MPRQPIRFAVAASLALLVAVPVAATTIRPPKNLGELARMCRAVVLARAVDDRVEDRGLPFTITSFELVERVGGAKTRFAFDVEVPGGELETTAAIVTGAPRFASGRNYLLFLARSPRGGWRPQILGWGLLEEVGDGFLKAVPEAAQLELLDDGERPIGERPTVYRERELLAHLREVLAGAPWDAAKAGVVRDDMVIAKLHTKPAICQFQAHSDGLPLRKFGYETGATMSIAHTTPGQTGIADGGVSSVQQGVAAWTNHADSVMTFLYGGSRARNISCSTNSDLDQGGVVYNDPCNDIVDLVGCAGTLAFGGSFYSLSTQSYDGEPWHTVTTAFVVVNNGTQCVGETKFKTMMTHELGHTQGFGHHTDPTATMAATLPNDSRGAALASTDRTCASYAYHTFLDVPFNYWSWKFIEAIENRGVTSGCGGGNYCPTAPMTRGDMAIFLLKAKEGGAYFPPPCTTPLFNDVPCSSGYAIWVNELARRGVTAGCGGGNYCPNGSVTRAEMSVFLLSTLRGPGFQPPACVVPRFLDVPCSTPFAPWINEMARLGITAGCGGGNYCPTAVVPRDQMAVFITQTFALPTP